MNDEVLLTPRNRWFATSVGIVLGVLALTALGGFVLLPYLQPNLKVADIWDAICSAAGVPARSSGQTPVVPDGKLSRVAAAWRRLRESCHQEACPPHCPVELSPHATRLPPDTIARLWSRPQATAVTPFRSGISTGEV